MSTFATKTTLQPNSEAMQTTARNPWHKPGKTEYGPETYVYYGKPLSAHRGVSVFWNHRGSYDYVFAGVTITQRAGLTKSRVHEIVDSLLTGNDQLSNSTVKAHIRANTHE